MKQKLQEVLNFLNELRAESLFKLHDKRREAMETITEAMKELDKIAALELKQETIADIAYEAGVKRYYSGNSREDIQHFIHLADKFEEEVVYRKDDNDDDDDTPEYMDAIEEFCNEQFNGPSKFEFNYPAGTKEQWDDIEIAACKIEDGGVIRLDEGDEETPDFYTVYLHRTEGGTMAIADLPTEKEALDVAELIHNAVISFKDNGFIPLNRNEELHRKFNLFIDERIHTAHSQPTKAAYEVVKDFFNKHVKA